MYRFATLLTVVVLLTGTTRAGADPIPQEVFEQEFTDYVMTMCIKALAEQSGTPSIFNDNAPVSTEEQWTLFAYRFGERELNEFITELGQRQTQLSNTIREKPLLVRLAWYRVTVQLCKKKLPD